MIVAAVQPEDPSIEPQIPPVSVVIAARNRAEVLRNCLKTLAEAGGETGEFEVVVVDLGSFDSSAETADEAPFVVLMRLPRNFGLTRARNVGARAAKGKYLLFLDPGVVCNREAIDALIEALDKDPSAAAAVPQIVESNGEVLPTIHSLPAAADFAEACLENRDLAALPPGAGTVECAGGLCFMVRRNFLAGMNFFDEKRYGEYFSETDMFRQIKSMAKQTQYAAAAKVALAAPAPAAGTVQGQALEAADRVSGAAAYLAKQEGFAIGVGFRLKIIFRVLGRLMAFRSVGFQFRLLLNLVNGAKIDGTQGGELG